MQHRTTEVQCLGDVFADALQAFFLVVVQVDDDLLTRQVCGKQFARAATFLAVLSLRFCLLAVFFRTPCDAVAEILRAGASEDTGDLKKLLTGAANSLVIPKGSYVS
jgi:hypothetical protein